MSWGALDGVLVQTAALVVSSLAAVLLARLSVYVQERTHNERLSRLVAGAGRVAGSIHTTLEALPPGADVAAVREAAISAGVQAVVSRYPDVVQKLDVKPDSVANMISAGLARLPSAAVSGKAPI